jgi:hypothetical protein
LANKNECYFSDVQGLHSSFGTTGSARPLPYGASFAQASSDLVTSSPDISASLLSSSFLERHLLDWPVAQEVVVEEIDFDLKTEVCLLVIFEFFHKKV